MKKKLTTKVISLMLAAVLALAVSGCAAPAPAQPAAPAAAPAAPAEQPASDGLTIGVIMINLSNPFYVTYVEAAQQAAADIGAELIIKSAEGSLEEEIALIENYIESGVDIILADFVNAEGLTDVSKKAADAGIPLISLFNEINSDYNYSCAYDHYVGFKGVTYAVAEALGGEGKICVMQGGIGNWASDERTRGFEEAIVNYPNIEVLAMQPCDWDPAVGVSITETWLTTYDDIDAILCMTDGVTPSIIEMVETAGRADEILVAGNDGEVAVLEAMKQDKAVADALLSSLRGGYLSILYSSEIAKGTKVDKTVWVPVSLVVNDSLKAKLEASSADMSFVEMISPDDALKVSDNYMNEFTNYFN